MFPVLQRVRAEGDGLRLVVRDLLRAEGLEEKVGRIDRLKTEADVIEGTAHGGGREDRGQERGT